MKYVFTFFLFALVSETGFTQNLLIGPKAGFQLSGAYSDNPHFYDNFYSRLLPTFQVGLVANVEVIRYILTPDRGFVQPDGQKDGRAQ